MTNLIVHILQGRPPGAFLNRCVASIEKTQLNYVIVPNEGKSILSGRYAGYDVDATHVSYLDDDDEIMLSATAAQELMLLGKPAIFTNSYAVMEGRADKPCIPLDIKQWSLRSEKARECRPHQTLILEKDTAVSILKETELLQKQKGWYENTCDFTFRLMVSTTVGWHYDPRLTYKWYVHAGGHHQTCQNRFSEIRNYFLGPAK